MFDPFLLPCCARLAFVHQRGPLILRWRLSDEVVTDLFADAPAPTAGSAWLNVPFEIGDNVEVIPFQFGTERYLMFFTNLIVEFGLDAANVTDAEVLKQMAASWTGGFVPCVEHRLVKLVRAEAMDPGTAFDPSRWRLADARQIFQFGHMLVDAVVAHAEAMPNIRQYLYKPEATQLGMLYKRAGAQKQAACAAGLYLHHRARILKDFLAMRDSKYVTPVTLAAKVVSTSRLVGRLESAWRAGTLRPISTSAKPVTTTIRVRAVNPVIA